MSDEVVVSKVLLCDVRDYISSASNTVVEQLRQKYSGQELTKQAALNFYNHLKIAQKKHKGDYFFTAFVPLEVSSVALDKIAGPDVAYKIREHFYNKLENQENPEPTRS